jgi:hypothetical protein
MILAEVWRAPLATRDQAPTNALTLVGRVLLVAIRGMYDVITLLRHLSRAGGCLLTAAAVPGWWSLDGLQAAHRVR